METTEKKMTRTELIEVINSKLSKTSFGIEAFKASEDLFGFGDLSTSTKALLEILEHWQNTQGRDTNFIDTNYPANLTFSVHQVINYLVKMYETHNNAKLIQPELIKLTIEY